MPQSNEERSAQRRVRWAADAENKRRKKREYYADHKQLIRDEVFEMYGEECVCCGEKNQIFLCIDHVNGLSDEEKGQKRVGGYNFWYQLRSAGYPPGYQTLCYNCNMAKQLLGVCPHQN